MKEKEKKSTDMTINTVIQLMQWFMAIKENSARSLKMDRKMQSKLMVHVKVFYVLCMSACIYIKLFLYFLCKRKLVSLC